MKGKEDKILAKLIRLSLQQLGAEPTPDLLAAINGSVVTLNLADIKTTDLPFLNILVTLELTQVTLKGQNQTTSRDVVSIVIKSIRYSETILVLRIQKCFELGKFGKELSGSLSRNRTLKELTLKDCGLDDNFVKEISQSLGNSSNINQINISHNHLTDIGNQVCSILEENNRYGNEKRQVFALRGDAPDQLTKQGLLELNLESNRIDTLNASMIAKYIRRDQWVRCINLNGNLIGSDAVRQFVAGVDQNKTILSLDLRNNPGFDIESSNMIFKKLLMNQNLYKSMRNKEREEGKNENNSADIGYSRPSQKNYTVNNINQENTYCEQCRKHRTKTLQAQKKIFDLQIENKKFKRLLQNRGFQISMINPSSQTEEVSFNGKNIITSDTSDDLVQKIEIMMAQLTKILEASEIHHHTQIDITNPLSTTHNMSNTVQILATNHHHSLTVRLPEEQDDISQIQR